MARERTARRNPRQMSDMTTKYEMVWSHGRSDLMWNKKNYQKLLKPWSIFRPPTVGILLRNLPQGKSGCDNEWRMTVITHVFSSACFSVKNMSVLLGYSSILSAIDTNCSIIYNKLVEPSICSTDLLNSATAKLPNNNQEMIYLIWINVADNVVFFCELFDYLQVSCFADILLSFRHDFCSIIFTITGSCTVNE